LMTHGITSWMQAWSQLAAVSDGGVRMSSDRASNCITGRMPEWVVPESAQPELVRVLGVRL
jgi:hypothetical protein